MVSLCQFTLDFLDIWNACAEVTIEGLDGGGGGANVSCELKFCQFVSLNFNVNLTRLTNPGDDL